MVTSAEVDDELVQQGLKRAEDFTKDLTFFELVEVLKPTIRSAARNPLKAINIIKELKAYYLNVKLVVEGSPVPVVKVDKDNELVCHEIAVSSSHHE